jgi:cap1 methyltransferase
MNFKPTYTNKNNKNIETQLNNNIIINKNIYNQINDIKSKIDDIEQYKWRLIRCIQTEYEFVGNNKFHNIKQLKERYCISRAYYKLWEILCHYENDFKLFQNKKPMRLAGLAEAPGGFIQCLVDYRNNKKDNLTGISLKDSKDNKIDWVMEHKNVKLIYGDEKKGHDGNLYNPEIIDYYCNYYKNKKADFVTADGGFLLEHNQENHKGQYHNHLFLAEIYIAMRILKKGGNFVIKIYDICNRTMIDLLTILNRVFRKVNVMKPVTSREMNNENYIVCIDYTYSKEITNNIKSIIDHMWKNDNLIINNILKVKNDNLINLFSKISKRKMLHQQRKLTNAISLKDKTREELIQNIKDIHKIKSKKAYTWLEKNYLN